MIILSILCAVLFIAMMILWKKVLKLSSLLETVARAQHGFINLYQNHGHRCIDDETLMPMQYCTAPANLWEVMNQKVDRGELIDDVVTH